MSSSSKVSSLPILMSGMRATGDLHIGHYFGALRNWMTKQDQYECYFGVMDLHGLTTAYKSSHQVSHWSLNLYAEYLSWGLNPDQSTLFIQSQIPEHIELYLYLSNLTPMGWLERVPTWKDAEDEAKASDTHNLGRFAYPVLQAADIALYRGMLVPVGQDQISHLELTREIIRRLNKLYKLRIPEPKPLLTETPLVPGLDGRKMSKSYSNTLGLTEDSGTLKKKILAMPTDTQRVRREDPGNPEKCGVFTYHKLVSTSDDVEWVKQECPRAGIGCGDCKLRLYDRIEQLIGPAREAKKEWLSHPEKLKAVIRQGNEKARVKAQQTLNEIKKGMGLIWEDGV